MLAEYYRKRLRKKACEGCQVFVEEDKKKCVNMIVGGKENFLRKRKLKIKTMVGNDIKIFLKMKKTKAKYAEK